MQSSKAKMTWEATILYARTRPEYEDLINNAYYSESLQGNVERYRKNPEFHATLKLIESYAPSAKSILDIGAGNGISTIAFALEGYSVTAVEPDPSNVVGAGAIRTLIARYNLKHVNIIQKPAEEIAGKEERYDVIFARQSMHHARDLNVFIRNASRFLKHGGMFLTVRDHVVFDDADKAWFLKSHPLHHFYGGENAYTPAEYEQAFLNGGLIVLRRLRHFDSVINYWPAASSQDLNSLVPEAKQLRVKLRERISFLAFIPGITLLYQGFLFIRRIFHPTMSEKKIPGRMYTYICRKP